ncbi:hypothetical protein V8E51_009113 [Hyaloscypha variabilis]
MANSETLTDDYLAELLAKDAKESAIKYSSMGLDAFKQSKPPANKPKPNTRFLRNIIKDTDSHNAALLAKEAADARARLRSLGSSEHRGEKSSRVGGGDIRRRQLGDIAAILGGKPRKRARVGEGGRRVNTSSEDEDPEEKSKVVSRRSRDSRDDREERSRSHRSHHRRHRSTSRERGKDSEDRRRRHRSRSGSPREHRSKEARYRERSPRRKRSRSPDTDHRRRKSHRSDREKVESESKKHEEKRVQEVEAKMKEGYYSDPLDDIIGPRPPPVPQVRTKGRGTISQASGIDARFAANYDPTTDVRLDSDEDDPWDQALEAMRARQKYKELGADRLRAAGFTEDEVRRWENGGAKREEDVRWAKKGEGREWDRGKVLDNDGVVSAEPEFGRLKDT